MQDPQLKPWHSSSPDLVDTQRPYTKAVRCKQSNFHSGCSCQRHVINPLFQKTACLLSAHKIRRTRGSFFKDMEPCTTLEQARLTL